MPPGMYLSEEEILESLKGSTTIGLSHLSWDLTEAYKEQQRRDRDMILLPSGRIIMPKLGIF